MTQAVQFSNAIEKYNDKMSIWKPQWLIITSQGLYFFDKKPSKSLFLNQFYLVTENDCDHYKEFLSFETIKIKADKDYKKGSMRKSYVIQLQMINSKLNKSYLEEMSSIILIALKNKDLFDKVISDISELKGVQPSQLGGVRKRTLSKIIPKTSRNVKHNQEEVLTTLGNNNDLVSEYQKFTKFNGKKTTCNAHGIPINSRRVNNKSVSIIKLNKDTSIVQKQRTQSCFDLSNVTQENKRDSSAIHMKSMNQINCMKEQRNPQKEENMSLCDLLNQMVMSSSKKQSNHKTTKSSILTSSSSTSSNQVNNKRKMNNIIKMNFNKSIEESFLDQGPSNHREKTKSQTNIDINSYREDEPDGKNKLITLGDEEQSNSLNLINKLDNYSVFIYDSYLFKKFRKENKITKQDLGKIYSGVQNTELKNQILIEMIGILSTQFLKMSITKSLEIVLKEKEINKYYFVNCSNQHSIEYCIIDIFNTFLGNTPSTDDLYTSVLPKYLIDVFDMKINEIRNLRQKISLHSLFIVMEYHSKVYFNGNIEIDFTKETPFTQNDIKYISPYHINKWHQKASDILTSITLFSDDININESNKSRNNPSQIITTTNAKRLRNNFELKQSKEMQIANLVKLKRNEELNDITRINLIRSINNLVCKKNYAYSLKLCDYYIQKFSDTISLNGYVYLFLAEIYNEINGIDYAKLFLDKTKNLIDWLYPNNTCHFIVDFYYTYSLILLKQNDSYIKDHLEEINDLLKKTYDLCNRFCKRVNEKGVKTKLQMIIFKLSYSSKHDIHSLKKDYEDLIQCMKFFESKQDYISQVVYLDFFSDLFKHCSSDEDMQRDILYRLYKVRKQLKE